MKECIVTKILHKIPQDALKEEYSPNNMFATGGIVTKLKAADFLLKRHKKMFLCSGFDLSSAESYLLHDEHTLGTLFTPKDEL